MSTALILQHSRRLQGVENMDINRPFVYNRHRTNICSV